MGASLLVVRDKDSESKEGAQNKHSNQLNGFLYKRMLYVSVNAYAELGGHKVKYRAGIQ